MTGLTRTSGGLDARRRRLLFRAWHRGMRELDLIFGRFVEAGIDSFDPDELAELEGLLDVPDQEMLSWITGQAPLPAAQDTPLFAALRTFRETGGGEGE